MTQQPREHPIDCVRCRRQKTWRVDALCPPCAVEEQDR